ncbi:MAG: hypothetical protein NVSMB27_41550 [Ktedonobacteraceae bacterium]
MLAHTGQLIVQLEGQVIQTLSLNTSLLSIGRTPENGLSLPHPLVSRSHAELRLQAQGLTLTDLASSNGTFIGDQRLLPNQPRILANGATFRIGPYILTYQESKPSPRPWQQEDDPRPEPEPPVILPVPVAVPPPVRPHSPQPTKPVPRSHTDASDGIYRRDLPDIFQENDFLRRFLLIFEDIWEPLEQRQDHIAMYFDPRTCPVSFLPWLASWLDLPFNAHWPEVRRRRLLAQAMELYSWRGTRYGLVRMIEVCTGLTPVITESTSQPFVFQIRLSLPAGSSIDKDLIEDLIHLHKPAHAGYILEVNT